MLWVLVVLCSIELVVVHLLVALWSRPAAIVLSAFSLAGIGWLVVAIRSMRRLPVVLDGDTVLLRSGLFRSITLPRQSVARWRQTWDAAMLKRRGVLNLALVAWPNVVLELEPPLSGRRGPIHTVAHRLDDPAAFATALAAVPRVP